jgi:hypothetical protein
MSDAQDRPTSDDGGRTSSAAASRMSGRAKASPLSDVFDDGIKDLRGHAADPDAHSRLLLGKTSADLR